MSGFFPPLFTPIKIKKNKYKMKVKKTRKKFVALLSVYWMLVGGVGLSSQERLDMWKTLSKYYECLSMCGWVWVCICLGKEKTDWVGCVCVQGEGCACVDKGAIPFIKFASSLSCGWLFEKLIHIEWIYWMVGWIQVEAKCRQRGNLRLSLSLYIYIYRAIREIYMHIIWALSLYVYPSSVEWKHLFYWLA